MEEMLDEPRMRIGRSGLTGKHMAAAHLSVYCSPGAWCVGCT